MLIKILKSTVCGGKDVTKGSEIEADKGQAKILIRMGKAVAVEPAAVEPTVEKKVAVKKSKKKSGLKKSSNKKED